MNVLGQKSRAGTPPDRDNSTDLRRNSTSMNHDHVTYDSHNNPPSQNNNNNPPQVPSSNFGGNNHFEDNLNNNNNNDLNSFLNEISQKEGLTGGDQQNVCFDSSLSLSLFFYLNNPNDL